MIIPNHTVKHFLELTIDLFISNPKRSKLILNTPLKHGAIRENQIAASGIKTDIRNCNI